MTGTMLTKNPPMNELEPTAAPPYPPMNPQYPILHHPKRAAATLENLRGLD